MHSAYVDLVYMTTHQCRSFVKFLFCQRFSESFIICLNSTDIWDWRYKSLEHISLWHHCTQPKLFILNSCSRDPLLCIFCMSPLCNTPNSDHQLIRRETFFGRNLPSFTDVSMSRSIMFDLKSSYLHVLPQDKFSVITLGLNMEHGLEYEDWIK